MVVGKICFFKNRCHLKLVGGNLVVASFCRNAKFVALNLKVKHKGFHTRRYRAEIVVFQLLVLSALMPHKRAPGHH